MPISELTAPPSSGQNRSRRILLVIRISFWMLGIILGIAQTWSVRHQMYSDGMSYLQIAIAYLNGDWANAINSYWSPLYSWVLAFFFLLLRPSPYWQVATLHFANFCCFVAGFAALELLLRECVAWSRRQPVPSLPDSTLYVIGYSCLLFQGLSQVHIGNTSPDMLAMALTLFVTALVWRIACALASWWEPWIVGILCAALFLARTAFAPCVLVCLFTVAVGLHRHKRSWIQPTAIVGAVALICSLPFVIAISVQQGRFTIGESGRLNYAWEVNDAPRFRHWQGKPAELGKPLHPTVLAVANPATYTFAEPVGGTYPPWYNPAYWYEGVRVRFHLRAQLWVLAVNLSVLFSAFVRSPILVPSLLLIPFCGTALWWRRYLDLWPAILLPLSSVALYSLVYVERRYLGANILALWLTLALSLAFLRENTRRLSSYGLAILSICFVLAFVALRQKHDVRIALSDLFHRRESYPNIQYALSRQVRRLGIRAGDRVAYIGSSDNADWTRLAGVKIVAEVPVNHDRNRKLFNNTMIDDYHDVFAFWDTRHPRQQPVLDAFRKLGVKLVVTDGANPNGDASGWPLLLPEAVIDSGDSLPSPERSRYLLLNPK